MNHETSIVWFRNDLRLHDHVPLTRGIQHSSKVIPVYVLDPRKWRSLSVGFKKTGPFQTRFLLESLQNLKQNLQKRGSDLVILKGHPEEELLAFAKAHNASAIYASKEVTWEETQIESKLETGLFANRINLELLWHSTLFHIDDIPWPIQNVPDVFTKFRKENEKTTEIRKVLPSPDTISSPNLDTIDVPKLSDFGFDAIEATQDARLAIELAGGEDAAWDRLNDYFWKQNLLHQYKNTRNGLIGADYSSKFSLWLAHGCISPRAIYEEVKRYEEEEKKNVSTYWLVFELTWRDYFRFVCKKYGNKVFQLQGIKDEPPQLNQDLVLFEKWRRGATGIPFIDANMKELLLTGFISNRGRQNVASFLIKDLQVDWRWGASWFESQLIDYDVCTNWGNWMYVAGVGNDPRDRYFNVISQALKYDSGGAYVRLWLPELDEIPGNKIHFPSELHPKERRSYGVELGSIYPEPLVNVSRMMSY